MIKDGSDKDYQQAKETTPATSLGRENEKKRAPEDPEAQLNRRVSCVVPLKSTREKGTLGLLPVHVIQYTPPPHPSPDLSLKCGAVGCERRQRAVFTDTRSTGFSSV